MHKLRLAVIGAGRLGGFHAQKLAALDEVELLAVVDPSAENRQRVAAECRTAALADYHPLLEELDAAVIAAPTSLHHKLAMELLGHGIHLLVEKPICATLAEADELVDTARRQGALLQVGHVERFNPAFTAAAQQVRNAKYIEAVRSSPFTFRSTDVGVVLDLMIHDIDLLLSIVGSRVRKVDALGISVLGGHEDVANARLQFDCGCVATLSASRVSYQSVRQMQIWSPRVFAAVDFAARTTTLVRPSETLRRRQLAIEKLSPQQVAHYREHLAEEHLPQQRLQFEAVDALTLELRDFIDSIHSGRSPRVSGAQGRDALGVAEQILAAAEKHAWEGTAKGPVGPRAAPRISAVPAPHFDLSTTGLPLVGQETGPT